MADTETNVITQPDGQSFRVVGRGELAHHGEMAHRGELVHATPADRPLVHMLMLDRDCECSVNGRVVLGGEDGGPVRAEFRHVFPDVHHQSHAVRTALDEPIHHALQMRTPLQVRFCNAWHIASDYTMEVTLGRSTVLTLRLTGATIAKPQPC